MRFLSNDRRYDCMVLNLIRFHSQACHTHTESLHRSSGTSVLIKAPLKEAKNKALLLQGFFIAT